MIAVGIWLAHATEFGRTVYAIGGSEPSAVLMGLPVARTTVLVYTFSGFCSALAGVVFTFYMLSGYGLHAVGWSSTRSPPSSSAARCSAAASATSSARCSAC